MIVSLPQGVGVDAEAVKSVHVRSDPGTGRAVAVVYSVVVRTETEKHVVAVCTSRAEAEAVSNACWEQVNEALEVEDRSPARFPWPSRRAVERRAEAVASGESPRSELDDATGPAPGREPEPVRSPLADAAPVGWSDALRRAVELAGSALVAEGEELAVPELAAAIAELAREARPELHPLSALLIRNPDLGQGEPTAVGCTRAAWAACVRDALHRWRCASADAAAPERVRALVGWKAPAAAPEDAIGRLASALGEPASRVAVTFGLKGPRDESVPGAGAYQTADAGDPWPGPWPSAAEAPEALVRAAVTGWGPWYREAARRGLAPRVDGHVGNQLAMWQRAVTDYVPREPAKRLRRARAVGQSLGWVALAVEALLAHGPHEVVAGRAHELRDAVMALLRACVEAERELPVAVGPERSVGRLWSAFREGFDGAARVGAFVATDAVGLDAEVQASVKAFEDRFAALAGEEPAGPQAIADVVAAGEVACTWLSKLRAAAGRNRYVDAWLEDLTWRVALRVHAAERWGSGELPAWSIPYDEAQAFRGASWALRSAAWASDGTFAARDLPATTPAAIDALVAARARLQVELGQDGPVLPWRERPASARELEGGAVRGAQAEVARCAARLLPVLEALESAAIDPSLRSFLAGHVATCKALGGTVQASGAVRATVGQL